MLLRQIPKRCIYTAAALADPRSWHFLGLGNPGDKFLGTRHNVGFEFTDAFAKSHGIVMDSVHCEATFGKGFVNGVPVFLAKPQTYMNLSGESVRNSLRLVKRKESARCFNKTLKITNHASMTE